MTKITYLYLVLLIGTLSCPLVSFAQLTVMNNFKRGIFLEVGGNSVGYSVNVEQKLVNNPAIAMTARFGLGGTFVDWYAPLGLQILFLTGKHHLVISPTVTVRVELRESFSLERSDTFLHLNTGVGYRFQSRNSRVYAQGQLVPGFQLDPTSSQLSETVPIFQIRIGVAVGVYFEYAKR